MSKQVDLRTKVTKELPEFVSEVASLTTEEINARLAALAKADDANEEAKEADEDFHNAKLLVSELSAPYRDARKVVKLKARYLILLLKDRGANG